MNGYSKAIYLAGLLFLLITESAIAEDTTLGIFNSCEEIPSQISTSLSNVKNNAKVESNRNINDQKNPDSDITEASFWWTIEQFDPFGGKLVQNWLAHPKKQQIDLVVNWQLWTLLDYLGRYRFVNQFGTVARKYGYSLNIFNQKEQCLATYKYNAVSNPPKWELYLERLGQDSLQIETPEELYSNPI